MSLDYKKYVEKCFGFWCAGRSAALPHASMAQTADAGGPTLKAVKQRGELVCGVDTGMPGYAFQDVRKLERA